jgi:hypothetical protein
MSLRGAKRRSPANGGISLFSVARNGTLFLTYAPIFTNQSLNKKELEKLSLNNSKTTPALTRINKNDSFELKDRRKTNAG